ncbi:MAG: SLC13 family permease [Planctomycetota bacterium]
MAWEAWFTFAVVAGLLAGLARRWAGADLLCLAALTVVVLVGAVTGTDKLPDPGEAVAGFGNTGLVTIAALFIVVAGLVKTGALDLAVAPMLGRPKTHRAALTRMMLPVAGLSAFLNNTPVVAMFLPIVRDLARRTGISPGQLYLPLSYASIFGGLCTLIGTSTNLIVNGLVIEDGGKPFGMFDMAWVGLPCLIVGLTFLLLFGKALLPDRGGAVSLTEDPREYTVEVIVDEGGPMHDKTVEQAGLRHLPGLFLTGIVRADQVIPAVGPEQKLMGGDRLVLVGLVSSVVDLLKMRGLSPATGAVAALTTPKVRRQLVEAVVSDRCPIVGQSIRAGNFRSRYGAAVIAIARSGKRLEQKIGDVVLRPGDTLLIEAGPGFVDRQRDQPDFFLVSALEDSAPTRHDRAYLAIGVLVAMVAAVTLGLVSMLVGALVAAVVMMATRCCTGSEARRSIDWPVLIVIGAALGLGQSLQSSGGAAALAHGVIEAAGGRPWLVLAAVYLVTVLLTEVITNNAAAVLVYAIAISVAAELGVDPRPLLIVVMLAASASFASPIGYQTNLMVFGPGGYRFTDYLRIGLPLHALIMATAVTLTPLIWPFNP